MRSLSRLLAALLLAASCLSPLVLAADAASAVGPFFESDFPYFQAQVQLVPPPKGELVGGNFVVRGIVLPLPSGYCVVFDQELMRLAGLWKMAAPDAPITPMTMAQISYVNPKRKAAAEHPQPTGPLLLTSAMHPGVSDDFDTLFVDPRPPKSFGDEGRGALPADFARFDGIELAGATAVLHYHTGTTAVTEWHESSANAGEALVLRHLEIAPHAKPLHFNVGAPGLAKLRLATNSTAVKLHEEKGEMIATVTAATKPQRVTIAMIANPGPDEKPFGETPPPPKKLGKLRWPGSATAPAQLASLQQDGLILDKVATPDDNPWKRRVRVADIAFLTDNRAAVLGYDGDVWLVDGFADAKLEKLTWRRFASGLHEPLAIAVVRGGIIQVATKNGVVRVFDRDGDGEADWIENFNDQLIQSQTTRSFPLDMGIGPDGSTFISQGGIVTRSGLVSGGEGTSQTGGILKISPDGKSSELFASGAREPFVAVNPKTGVVTATDQQGNYIPSSVSYLVRRGDNFGFLQLEPAKLTPPLAWVPHDQDSSSSSESWIIGKGMGPFDGKLVHLSYGTGRIFIISPDLDAPIPQGAVIPLDLRTDLPLLHARMNLKGDALWLAGFQIWGTRTTTNWALGRLRRGDTPVVTAIAARSTADGVILDFAQPLDPASVGPEKLVVRAWNYKRAASYGSARYALDGTPGMTPWGVAQTVLSPDQKSVFIHLPKLPAVHQLEVRHDFKLKEGAAARGAVYFTIHQPRPVDLFAAGFGRVDLTKTATVVVKEKEEPATVAMGKAVAESVGCVACHSSDGTTEGKVGPTWRRMFGTRRTFIDGTSEIADEVYIREKILDPQQKKMKPGQVEMPSYRGVLGEQQLESLVLYIKSLSGRAPARDDG
jgi:glucose/arabinose dehydrogenase/mono/diheme cytochrome c family protein